MYRSLGKAIFDIQKLLISDNDYVIVCSYMEPKTAFVTISTESFLIPIFNPFSAGTAFMLMQTGWIQASRRVTRRLAWDPTYLLLSPSFPIKNKQNLKVLKSRRQHNLFLENYPAFKGLIVQNFSNCEYIQWCYLHFNTVVLSWGDKMLSRLTCLDQFVLSDSLKKRMLMIHEHC